MICKYWAAIAVALAYGLLAFVALHTVRQLEQPRLVGYGCEGPLEPLYAMEEDHFPHCVAIEGIE